MRQTITETGNADRTLAMMPLAVREKALKKALGRGVRVEAKEARRTAPREQEENDDTQIRRSIRTDVRVEGSRVVATSSVKGKAAIYANAVEFGHVLVAWGRRTDIRIPATGFKRRAADTTQNEQNHAVIQSLKATVHELV